MKFIYAVVILLLAVSCNTANKNMANSKANTSRQIASEKMPENVLHCGTSNYGRKKRMDYTDAGEGNRTYYSINIRAKNGDAFNVYGNTVDGLFEETVAPLIQQSQLRVPENLYKIFSKDYGTYSYASVTDSSVYKAYGRLGKSVMYAADDTNIVVTYNGKQDIFSPRETIPSYTKYRAKLDEAISFCNKRKLKGDPHGYSTNEDNTVGIDF